LEYCTPAGRPTATTAAAAASSSTGCSQIILCCTYLWYLLRRAACSTPCCCRTAVQLLRSKDDSAVRGYSRFVSRSAQCRVCYTPPLRDQATLTAS
jgi:hypothetical protein